MSDYCIGNVHIRWLEGNFTLEPDEFTNCFLASPEDSGSETITYQTEYEDLAWLRMECPTEKNDTYEMYPLPRGRFLLYHWAHLRYAYGFYADDLTDGNVVNCFISPKMIDEIPLCAARFFSTAGLHSKLLQFDAVILHASYIDYDGQAILFMGPSGMGKSTQAALWQQFAGAEIINGDRVLLRQQDGVWYAFGYPCCGSSAICVNRTLPLRAIVVLQQGPKNRVDEVSVGQRVRALLAGAEVYRWSTEEIDRALSICTAIANDVPTIRLTCLPNHDAVESLRRYLEVL